MTLLRISLLFEKQFLRFSQGRYKVWKQSSPEPSSGRANMDLPYDPKIWDTDSAEFNVELNYDIDSLMVSRPLTQKKNFFSRRVLTAD